MIGYLEMNFPVLLAVLWLGYRAAGDPFDVQTIATMVSKMFVETGFVHEIFPLQLVGKIKFLTFTVIFGFVSYRSFLKLLSRNPRTTTPARRSSTT